MTKEYPQLSVAERNRRRRVLFSAMGYFIGGAILYRLVKWMWFT